MFLIQHLTNILAAYKYFNAAALQGCTLDQQFQIYVAKKLLKDKIQNKNQKRNHIIPQRDSYKIYDHYNENFNFTFSPDYESLILYERKMI
jgi:hypothetical protein